MLELKVQVMEQADPEPRLMLAGEGGPECETGQEQGGSYLR